MRGFGDFLLKLEAYHELLDALKKDRCPISVTGVSETQKAHLIYALCLHVQRPALIVTYNDIQAKKIYEDLRFFMGDQVKYFPGKEFIFYGIEASSTDIVRQRMKIFDALYRDANQVTVVTSIGAILQLIMPSEVYGKYAKTFSVGMVYRLQNMIQDFIIMGYERVDMVEGRGQFSVRGGIVDIYPLISDYAYRIEFFDDEIDSIREIDVNSQRSIEKVNEICVSAAREVIFDRNEIDGIVERMNGILQEIEKKIKNGHEKETFSLAASYIKADIEKIKQQHYFPSIGKYLPIIYEEYFSKDQATLLQYISSSAFVFLDEPARIREQVETIWLEYSETIKTLIEKGLVVGRSSKLILNYAEFISKVENKNLVGLSTFARSNPSYRIKYAVNMITKTLHSFNGKLEFLYNDLEQWKKKKYYIVILASTKRRGEELVQILNERDFNSIYIDKLDHITQPGQIVVTQGSLNKGFEYPFVPLVVISEKEVFKQKKITKKNISKKHENTIKVYTDLNVRDYIVHQNHGIGQYIGIEKLVIEGVVKDYIKIRYYGGDFLYVPINQLDLVQKYIGSEGKAPKLNKMGGADWTKIKTRVKASIQDIAKGLIELYATRQALKGYAFTPDTTWQAQFEDMFPYEETVDQLRCIEEVKKDMESPRPMERLLCGDVGYGKTEVAIRAAFKAVMDGKQVAYLVPTTILAQQHYSTFVQRMRDFPVKVEMLSRFRSIAEQKRIVKQLRTGEIDIVIGTHRILQRDLEFKDLGLLIIDEEQRFGVAHKEKIKNFKKNIDVLTLTATPIPRTLHMSMIGIRDMSALEEPPEERYPVQTFVLEYNYALIQDAINRELSRGGQVYYLFNRVQGIQKVAQQIKEMIPEARVGIAHGQMNETELENIMVKVIEGEVDILVCTTIIETGLDIPNVNTIIIEDADRMGLAQLYQLRGRVGRSNRQAYAYITYRKDKVLQETAEKRLQAIKEFTEFGSGFRIAMRDLEIRGAGNLLGPEQHGHMEAVGYEMYCKILQEAVRELKGETIEERIETSVDLNVSAYISDRYIINDNQRVEIYKKIASIRDIQDAYDIEEEIEDRYGDLLPEVHNLIKIALVKSMANNLGIIGISQKSNKVIIQFANDKIIDMKVIFKLINQFSGQMLFTASDKPYLTYKIKQQTPIELLENIKIILQQLKELQAS